MRFQIILTINIIRKEQNHKDIKNSLEDLAKCRKLEGIDGQDLQKH